MKTRRFSTYLIILLITFFVGISSVPKSYPLISLEEISKNSEYYDGKKVEITTYMYLDRFDQKDFMIGEPYEKYESNTSLDLNENLVNLDFLKTSLSANYSVNHYKRIKVRVKGKVIDNCNKGITCCFGKTLRIIAESVDQIGQIEDYSVPEEFQITDRN